MKRLLPLVAILFYGCAHKSLQVPLPPLPRPSVYGAADVPTVAIVHKGPSWPRLQPSRFELAWENPPSPFASNYLTVVEMSVDRATWGELTRVPFVEHGSFSVTNNLPEAYYRIGNTLKP